MVVHILFLQVGVHNGWQFVKPPHTVYLEKAYTQPSPNKSKRSSRPGSSLSNTTSKNYQNTRLWYVLWKLYGKICSIIVDKYK